MVVVVRSPNLCTPPFFFFACECFEFFQLPRGCVPANNAILFIYFHFQPSDAAAVVSFFIILATHISSYDDDNALVVCRPLAPCSSFPPFLGYRYSSSFLPKVGGPGDMIR